MALPRYSWPPVVGTLAREIIRAAQGIGLHGRLRVHETRETYEIVIVIARGETVMTRAPLRTQPDDVGGR
jgi:hypothetical protein